MINTRLMTITALLSTVMMITQVCHADVSLNPLFSKSMVMQRNTTVDVWGNASNGEKVTVTIDDQSYKTTCTGSRWAVKTKPMPAGGPYSLTVSGNNTITVSEVYVGDVWLLSGDENISLPLSKSADAVSTVLTSTDVDMHVFTVASIPIVSTTSALIGSWVDANSIQIPNISAIAYFFGRQIRQQVNVPVGIIVCADNYSKIQSWINPQTPPTPGSDLRYRSARMDGQLSYNGLIAPIIPYSLKGVVWYQGKANLSEAFRYRFYLSDLIRGWRSAWGHVDMPFIIVQLGSTEDSIMSETYQESLWAELRDSQTMVSRIAKNTSLVNIIDLPEQADMVPQNKRLVAQRIALTALGKVYKLSLEHTGPQFAKLDIMGNQAFVSFINTDNGLVGRSGTVQGFAIAGSDRKWYPADAYVAGDRVLVNNNSVFAPVAVRYGWADKPDTNLYNRSGFPAFPFRTDKWPLTSQPLSSK